MAAAVRPVSAEGRESYDQGYLDGLQAGGERLFEEHLPGDAIFPDLTAGEAMAAGVQALRDRGVPLLGAESVYAELDGALRENRPYAFIRLGDGELLTLAQDRTLSAAEVKLAGPFLSYAGIEVPDLAARDELAACIRAASLVGVPLSRQPHYQPLLFKAFQAHGIDIRALRLTTSTMNYRLHEQGLLLQLLQGRRVLLVGNVAIPLAQVLHAHGIAVTGIVTPVNGFADAGRAVAEAAACAFDIALVAAGIAAIPIAVHLAGATGKVAVDFGHLANRIAGIEYPDKR